MKVLFTHWSKHNKKYKAILLIDIPYLSYTWKRLHEKKKLNILKIYFGRMYLVITSDALKSKSWTEFLEVPIWFYHNLIVRGASFYYPTRYGRGNLFVC